MEPFDLPMSSPSFMEPLANVRNPYKASYVPDMTFKPHAGESPINNLQSLYLDQNNFVQTSSQALDDVSSHNSALGSARNIYTNAPGLDHRLFSPQSQTVPHPLSDTTSTLYSRESTRHEGDKTDLFLAPLDPSIAFSMRSAQFPRPRFPGDQSDGYSYTDHPPYTENLFVYFQRTPPRIKETTYQPPYNKLFPTANRAFSNVIWDPHQPKDDSKSRPCLTSADAVRAEETKTSEKRDQKWSSFGIILGINFRFLYKYLRARR